MMLVRSVLAMLATALLTAQPSQAARLDSAHVMAPLDMRDAPTAREVFRDQLRIAKNIGVDAVSVDVWWGIVEKAGNDRFDWSYYDGVFQDIRNAGLKVQAIMSFHQCGGNVGDDCNIPLPSWLWTGLGVPERELQYRSEADHDNGETLSLWRDAVAVPQYAEFINAFEDHYGDQAALFSEITLSAGPAGELRYPAYSGHDGADVGYPSRGFFQAYSGPAQADFRAWTLRKYGSLEAVDAAWGSRLAGADDIHPPSDSPAANGRAALFVDTKAYAAPYGRDFLDWYNGALVEHGRRMLEAAATALDGALSGTPIGIKVPGVHWQMMAGAAHPRIAEMTAGLIPTSLDYGSDATAHGYQPILDMIASTRGRHPVVLHFTCLEKDNMEWDGGAHAYSLAKDLVFWVAQGAQARGVPVKGENALASGVTSGSGWNNITNAFTWAAYGGLTVLRIADVTYNATGQARYKAFIHNSR